MNTDTHGWTFVPTAEELERIARLADDRPELEPPYEERLPSLRVSTLIEAAALCTFVLLAIAGCMVMRGCF